MEGEERVKKRKASSKRWESEESAAPHGVWLFFTATNEADASAVPNDNANVRLKRGSACALGIRAG